MVKPTMNPPYVEPSGRSRSSAASEMDTVRRFTNGIRMNQKSHVLCLLQPVHGAVDIRKILDHGPGYRTLQSGGGSGLVRSAVMLAR